MKKYIAILCCTAQLCFGQSSEHNYIVKVSPTAIVTNVSQLSETNSLTTIQYFDGLGRRIEVVQKSFTPTGKDLIATQTYDGVGREYQQWQPAPSLNSDGSFVDLASFQTIQTSAWGDTKPYTQINYEPSPLNRVSQQYGAGDDWYTASKSVNTTYGTNGASEVICFLESYNNLQKTGYYSANSLQKTTVIDEDGKASSEYKDKQGRIVMKRQINGNENLDTYYVYNDLDQLAFVLSPKASAELSMLSTSISPENANSLNKLGYAYRYDDHGNCVWKKLPGCEPIYMVYDKADRLVLTQDGNQRTHNQWTYTKYDPLGRVVQTGITNITLNDSGFNLTSLQNQYRSLLIIETFGTGGYSNNFMIGQYPMTLTENYYDNYNFISNLYNSQSSTLTYAALNGFDSPYPASPPTAIGSTGCQGLLTGTMVKMLDYSASMITAMYYDDKSRVVQTRANNRLSGYDYEFFHYSFTGQVLNKCHVHKSSYLNGEITENYRFTYDNSLRPTGVYHTLNANGEKTLSTMSYDELGRMTQKVLYGGGQTINYSYNVRDWLKSISSPSFSQTLYYQDALDGKPVYYNGNISAQKWGKASVQDMKYYYSYDQVNRLKKATYAPDELYNEEITQYDRNGNPMALVRNGYVHDWYTEYPIYPGTIDDVTFSYNGNQMLYATDVIEHLGQDMKNDIYEFNSQTGSDYLYDANGNQTADYNRSIAWTQYNVLNLPQKIQFMNGNKTQYLYDAAGVKHKAIWSYAVTEQNIALGNTAVENYSVTATTSTDYCGNYVYENGKLKRILTPEGYINVQSSFTNSALWSYCFLIKDHQGNTRQLLSSDCIAYSTKTLYPNVKSTIDYYPFGMEMLKCDNAADIYAMPNEMLPGEATPYLYNGKEMDRMHGLYSYDYGARWRDGAIPMWRAVDPLCEKYYSISPYSYCGGNPIKYIDPDGKDVLATNTAARQMILNTLTKADRAYVVFNENGQINKDILNSANSSSGNLKALSQMVNDNKTFEVAVADKIDYKNENGDIITTNLGSITQGDPNDAGIMSPRTGEVGWTGVTQTPGSEPDKYNSTDGNVKITVNSGLSEKGQAQTFAHEGYGHGFLYSLGLFHKHNVQNVNGKMKETNETLKQQIIDRIDETEKNQQQK